MDAKITKDRLSNMLSYDWLKILVVIAAGFFAIYVLFTTIATRLPESQAFQVYAYTDLTAGEEITKFGSDLTTNKVFSYDILETGAESFGDAQYGTMAFDARRSAGQGDMMFVSDVRKTDKEGKEVRSALQKFVDGYYGLAKDVEAHFAKLEEYLVRFYGSDWREGALDEAEARACFMSRNGSDKRYKTAEQIEKGVRNEYGRIAKLREDYLFVLDKFADNTLSLVRVEPHVQMDDGEEQVLPEKAYAINVGKLSGIGKVCFYYEITKDEKTGDDVYNPIVNDLSIVIFNNGSSDGDLQFETVSLLRYLVEKYGNVQA